MVVISPVIESTRRLWIASPWGGWCLQSTDQALLRLDWQGTQFLAAPDCSSQPETELEHQAVALLHRYFQGERVVFDHLPLQLTGTPFQQSVWRSLASIPYGETRPYQWLAQQAAKPKAARAVGGALGRNPLPIILPCHRVITSAGGLGGFMSGRGADALALKEGLLSLEGIALGAAGGRLTVFSKG